jgi:hypothetical protein
MNRIFVVLFFITPAILSFAIGTFALGFLALLVFLFAMHAYRLDYTKDGKRRPRPPRLVSKNLSATQDTDEDFDKKGAPIVMPLTNIYGESIISGVPMPRDQIKVLLQASLDHKTKAGSPPSHGTTP